MILSLCRYTNENEQGMSVQVPPCLRKARRRQNAVAVKTCVGIYIDIAECRREIPGLQKRQINTTNVFDTKTSIDVFLVSFLLTLNTLKL